MSPDYPIIMAQGPSHPVHATIRKFRTVQTLAKLVSGSTVKDDLTVEEITSRTLNQLFGNLEQLKLQLIQAKSR